MIGGLAFVRAAEGGDPFPLPLGLVIEILLKPMKAIVNRNSINLEMQLVTIRQVKAARAMLGWSQADLADHSGISEPTIARLEAVDGELGGREGTSKRIRKALESAGVEFIDENGGGAGVRLREPRSPRGRRK